MEVSSIYACIGVGFGALCRSLVVALQATRNSYQIKWSELRGRVVPLLILWFVIAFLGGGGAYALALKALGSLDKQPFPFLAGAFCGIAPTVVVEHWFNSRARQVDVAAQQGMNEVYFLQVSVGRHIQQIVYALARSKLADLLLDYAEKPDLVQLAWERMLPETERSNNSARPSLKMHKLAKEYGIDKLRESLERIEKEGASQSATSGSPEPLSEVAAPSHRESTPGAGDDAELQGAEGGATST